MKLNLGCGKDIRSGYVNVDFIPPADQIVDLSKFPWPWATRSVEKIMMLDFLEHFPYAITDEIFLECNRILVHKGQIEVQVPDFKVCAIAASKIDGYDTQCNACGEWFSDIHEERCRGCGQDRIDVRKAAIMRLYGGQDRPGNWHFTAFTTELLDHHLQRNGFDSINYLERNENGETYSQNWNMRAQALKESEVTW